MTNNVVAQFSSSVDRYGYPKEYQVVSGSNFSEEYNESLDSGVLVLSQVKKEDRLSNIKSYDFVRVFDKSSPYDPTTGKYEFDKTLLVDNFQEKEDNIEEHLFSYTINLMSETKLLEKIQCPNLTITHKLDENGHVVKKTIFEHIKQYMELFVPKVKFSEDGQTWEYCPLIEVRSGEKHSKNIELSRLEARDFTPAGNDWELNTSAYLSFFHIDDIYLDSLVIKNIRVSGDVTFNSLSITFDKENECFVIYGITSQLPSEDVYISFDIDYCDTTFSKRFDVPCADFAFSAPTLRQVITTLMQQVGCIPTVNDRVLGYLDFQKEAVPFGGNKGYLVDNTVNYITRSLSSDSFVNTLVNMSSNVLDSGNKVICESLGFRDIGKVLLKQEENLYLETKFPIYKVENFVINSYIKANVSINDIHDNLQGSASGSNHIARWSISISKQSLMLARLNFAVSFEYDQNTTLLIDGHFVAFKYNTSSTQVFEVNKAINGNNFNQGVDDVFDFSLETDYDKFYFYGRLTVIDRTGTYASGGFDVFHSNFSKSDFDYLCLYEQDITKLLVENSIRQNLSTNFSHMVVETSGASATLETLAKYVYGTVGYSIGSKKIEGFSNTFNVGSATLLGWIQLNYTYIENIWNFITKNYTDSIIQTILKSWGNFPIVHEKTYQDGSEVDDSGKVNIEIDNIKPFNPYKVTSGGLPRIFTSDINFTYLWFDITYQPLNSFNLAYVKSKEDIDYTLEQYDSNASGLTDFDRMSINEQEQVDRVGNEVLSISQRTADSSLLQNFKNGPLYYEDDTNRNGDIEGKDKGVKYIIFKRSFTINNNHFDASYVGSKDAVLKNYFTSIRTKYRAYQYVDYNASVLRKEKDVFYVKISENGFYDGDDHIFFGSFTSQNLNNQTKYLIKLLGNWTYNANGDFTNVSDENYFGYATCCVLSDEEQQTKNDISIVSTNNFFAIIMEEADNVGSGTYISGDALQQAFSNYKAMLGGVPQTWQIWNEGYNKEHIVSYVSEINMNDVFESYINASSENATEIYNDMNDILKMPILDEKFANLFNNDTQNVVLSVVKNNKSVQNNNYKRVFYKDGAERINHTVQFIYYTDSESIIWNENFFNLNGIAGKLGVNGSICLIDIQGQDFKLNNEEYTDSSSKINTNYHDIITFHDGSNDNSHPYIQINWNHINSNQFKVTSINAGRKKDIIAFKKGENDIQKFFVTLNDTKTDYVLTERNGILFRHYKVKLYTSKVNNSCPRVVIPIYSEEE